MATATATPMTLTQKIIAIAVTIIIISTVAIPIIDEVQHSFTTEENNTAYRYQMLDENSTMDLEVTGPATIVINGYTVTPMLFYSAIVIGENFFVNTAAGSSSFVTIQYYDPENSIWTNITSVTKVIWNNGTINYTTTSTTGTLTDMGSTVYCPYSAGEYGYYSGGTAADFGPVYIDDNQDVIIGLRKATGSSPPGFNGIYSVNTKTWEVTEIQPLVMTSYTASDLVWTFEKESTDFGVELTKIGLTFTANGTDYSIDTDSISAIILISPVKYTVEDTSSTDYQLFGVIPILLILVPVMLAVRMIALRRN